MDEKQATALRKPFPKEVVGKLPKPYKADSAKGNCGECGGWHGLPAAHLDFAGHAAVTDRLLTVDPEWSWEPMAFDQYGSPQLDRDNNLWIKLTICGVTRLGCGDGKNMKERIGDAVRNGAMRFGVGLDLWAKENLVEFAQAAQAHQAPPNVRELIADEVAHAEAVSGPDDLTEALETAVGAKAAAARRGMFAEFGRLKVPDDAQLAGINALLGTTYASSGDLTETHARAVIADLKTRPTPKES